MFESKSISLTFLYNLNYIYENEYALQCFKVLACEALRLKVRLSEFV